jgi:hypothetical protein
MLAPALPQGPDAAQTRVLKRDCLPRLVGKLGAVCVLCMWANDGIEGTASEMRGVGAAVEIGKGNGEGYARAKHLQRRQGYTVKVW